MKEGKQDKSPVEAVVMDTRNAAAYIDQTPGTLEVWRCQRRGPPYVKQGRSVKYRRADLDAWLAANTVHPSEEARG